MNDLHDQFPSDADLPPAQPVYELPEIELEGADAGAYEPRLAVDHISASGDFDGDEIGVPADRGGGETPKVPEEPAAAPTVPQGGGPNNPPPDGPPTPSDSPDDDDILRRYAEELGDAERDIPRYIDVEINATNTVFLNRVHPNQARVDELAETAAEGFPEGWFQLPDDALQHGEIGHYVDRNPEEAPVEVWARAVDPNMADTEVVPAVETIEQAVRVNAVLGSDDVRDEIASIGYSSVQGMMPLAVMVDRETGLQTEYYELSLSRLAEGIEVLAAENIGEASISTELIAIVDASLVISTALEVNGIDPGDLGPMDMRINDTDRSLHLERLNFDKLEIPSPTLNPGEVSQHVDGQWQTLDAAVSDVEYGVVQYSAGAPGSVTVIRAGSELLQVLIAENEPGDLSCQEVTLWNPHTQEGAVVRFRPGATDDENRALLDALFEYVPSLGKKGTICHIIGRGPEAEAAPAEQASPWFTAAGERLYAQGLRIAIMPSPASVVRLVANTGIVNTEGRIGDEYSYRPPRRVIPNE